MLECAGILRNKGFEVRGIVSKNPRIEAGAREVGIDFVPLDENILTSLSTAPFEYLFSITHLEVLEDAVVDLPEKFSINFHDGLLPKYAGLNCPVWALQNNEQNYGITWHQITSGIDKGDILLQQEFAVSADETALSLNTKCFAAALESFPKLLDNLLQNTVVPIPQDFASRQYFPKNKRPESAAFIDWSLTADEIDLRIRALDFGKYPNPVSAPKVRLGGDDYVVTKVGKRVAHGKPGEVVQIENDSITIATASDGIVISELLTLRGQARSLSSEVKQQRIEVGQLLENVPQTMGVELSELDSRLAVSEDFWVNRLSDLSPLEVPGSFAVGAETADEPFQSLELELDNWSNDINSLICAYLLLLGRVSDKNQFDVIYSLPGAREDFARFNKLVSPYSVFRLGFNLDGDLQGVLNAVEEEINLLGRKPSWLQDLVFREPELSAKAELHSEAVLPVCLATESSEDKFIPFDGVVLALVLSESGPGGRLVYRQDSIRRSAAERMHVLLRRFVREIHQNPAQQIKEISLLTEEDSRNIHSEWNTTEMDYPSGACMHEMFEQQVTKTPDKVALIFEGLELTYSELNQHANRLAHELVDRGISTDGVVGLYVERSMDLVIGALGILKAGGAYLPLDPLFPKDRISYMIADAKVSTIVTQTKLLSDLPTDVAEKVVLDKEDYRNLPLRSENPVSNVQSTNLSYVIYTSGSTGQPKGVMVEHKNLVNFFTGMDACIKYDDQSTWLAVTSLSFDISVLELFWTLARGLRVVIYTDNVKQNDTEQSIPTTILNRPMAFGLFMWGNDDGAGSEKYRLMLEGAKYFDENGFDSVWTPERHFHAFGGPYPNPAVTGAALAAITSRIGIRAGSCVSPLHHPIRIAEDWSVIDNLSNGRVGLSFASGWQPNDFVIKPENHKNNKQIMLDQIEMVRKLWRGESVAFENPMGDMVDVKTLPKPVQDELPVWVTTAGNPETYKQAGALGANILTHLLGQTVDELAEKIKLYRDARSAAGFDPNKGKVTLMLHTFVGPDTDTVRELVRNPMKDYLKSAMKLAMDFAWSFPAFKRPRGQDTEVNDIDIKSLSEEEVDVILDFAFERYFENSGLFGTPESCIAMINKCKQADIDEIACLLDFGVDTNDIMQSLPFLKRVRDGSNPDKLPPQLEVPTKSLSFPEQVEKYSVTHMQCTPSMARMLMMGADTKAALKKIDHLMVGGEALPDRLASELIDMGNASLTNMYGPTETTIWSTTQKLDASTSGVPIGQPIANTKIYILDRYRSPVPPGMPGELFIGGEGVVRGYLHRTDLTAERFIPNPESGLDDDRIYWTGDMACYREDGVIDFLGRLDHQVKIRGYRIELGEIESKIESLPDIHESVVVLREDTPGDQRLIAYVVAKDPNLGQVKDSLRKDLPEYMVPAELYCLPELPLTPNGKVDRNNLPEPASLAPKSEKLYEAPENALEEKLVSLWQNTLKISKVGTGDNFFDLGGHSLLIVKLHSELKEVIDQPVSLTDLYRFPTIRSLVDYINSSGSGEQLKESSERAQRRREIAKRRRRRG